MIWPEFEDENLEVILDNHIPVTYTGTARMWIADPDMREEDCNRIEKGLKCFFREGSKVTANCEVIEIADLHKNPKGRQNG